MCSVKLGIHGPYARYQENEQNKHPYVSWLLNDHYKRLEQDGTLSRLDDQANLAGQIGEARVESLVSILSNKL